MGADFVRHLEGIQRWIGGEEAAIVGGDVQAGIAFVNGVEQAAEIEPDGGRAIADPDRAPWFSLGAAQGCAPPRPAWLCLFRHRGELRTRAYLIADLGFR